MNVYLNRFDISTHEGAKILRRYLRKRGARLSFERIVCAGLIFAMSKVIVDQDVKIRTLKESEKDKKGD